MGLNTAESSVGAIERYLAQQPGRFVADGLIQRLFKGPSSAFVGLIASTGKFCCEKGEKSCGEPTFALTTTRKPFCELFFAASYAR